MNTTDKLTELPINLVIPIETKFIPLKQSLFPLEQRKNFLEKLQKKKKNKSYLTEKRATTNV